MSTSRSPEQPRHVLALIAHDEKKGALTDFCVRHRDTLASWELIGTGSTAQQLSAATGMLVEGYLSGPDGGDAQIAARVALARLARASFCWIR